MKEKTTAHSKISETDWKKLKKTFNEIAIAWYYTSEHRTADKQLKIFLHFLLEINIYL